MCENIYLVGLGPELGYNGYSTHSEHGGSQVVVGEWNKSTENCENGLFHQKNQKPFLTEVEPRSLVL